MTAECKSAEWRELFRLLPGYDPCATDADCYFDEQVAESACRFFPEQLQHIEDPFSGKPLELEPWQRALIGCAFGWKKPDGTRRYREVMLYVARKNGKSTLLGGLINLVAFCDHEAGAQIYSAASDRDQAALVFRQTRGMIERNPGLARHCKIYSSFKSIEYPQGTTYKALSAEAGTKHGFNSHFVVVDELHAQPNRELVDVLATSTGTRRQPMMWFITTADFDRESICNEKHEYASKVRDGIIDDAAFLPVLFEAKQDDDWQDPDVWRKANPNMGVSITQEYLARECKRAADTPSYLNTFLRLHLNIKTSSDVAWLDLQKWDEGNHEVPDMRGRECFAGLDLASTTDIAAFVKVFPPVGDEPWVVVPRFWIPADNARKRSQRDRVPYEPWQQQGFIEFTDGNVIDYDVIREAINEDAKVYNIKELACDRWNATQIITQLEGDGIEVIAYGQGFKDMTAPSKELEKLVMSGRLCHGGNPVLRWMAANVMIEQDAAGNIKPSKKKSTEKIDGIIATVMALGRAMLEPQEFDIGSIRL